jgi:uncharacterized RDD family membrane protein YckC
MKYAGFWIRFWASMIDTIIMLFILAPLMISIYGLNSMSTQISSEDMSYYASSYSFQTDGGSFFLNYILPAIVILAFWFFKSATPGKMLTKLTIVDAKSGKKPTLVQFILRYVGYFLSSIFLLGFIWVAFDKRKQGWHDKIAGTVVLQTSKEEEVKFDTDE